MQSFSCNAILIIRDVLTFIKALCVVHVAALSSCPHPDSCAPNGHQVRILPASRAAEPLRFFSLSRRAMVTFCSMYSVPTDRSSRGGDRGVHDIRARLPIAPLLCRRVETTSFAAFRVGQDTRQKRGEKS